MNIQKILLNVSSIPRSLNIHKLLKVMGEVYKVVYYNKEEILHSYINILSIKPPQILYIILFLNFFFLNPLNFLTLFYPLKKLQQLLQKIHSYFFVSSLFVEFFIYIFFVSQQLYSIGNCRRAIRLHACNARWEKGRPRPEVVYHKDRQFDNHD